MLESLLRTINGEFHCFSATRVREQGMALSGFGDMFTFLLSQLRLRGRRESEALAADSLSTVSAPHFPS